jgi:hypothetical protein
VGKSGNTKALNSKYAAWAADQISTRYKAQQSEEQLRDTKVLESIEKLFESLQVSG